MQLVSCEKDMEASFHSVNFTILLSLQLFVSDIPPHQ